MSLAERIARFQGGQPEDLSRLTESLPSQWIDEALQATGKASLRTRKLPASKAIWVVIGMALFSDRSIEHVVAHLGLTIRGWITSAGINGARKSLGAEPLMWLVRRIAEAWGNYREEKWRGLSLYGVDGSHLRVNDSDQNNNHFGRPSGRSGVGYPQMRMVGLMNLTSRIITGAAVGPYNQSEVTLAKGLWDGVPDGSLTIIDRGFLAFALLWNVLSKGTNRHFLIRLKSNSKYKIESIFQDGSAMASIETSSSLRNKNPEVPKTIYVRLIKYTLPGGSPSILMTSLMDASKYPARELIAVYHKRWELEIAFDEIKAHLLANRVSLRSKTVSGVYQEFWGVILLYNLVRREMACVAEEKNVEPCRISFTSAHLIIQNFFLASLTASPGTIPRDLGSVEDKIGRTFLLPKRRSQRRYPRQVKIKMSSYPKAAPRARRSA